MYKHRIYGTASVNEKGQIVIPADARKELGIGPNDKVVVIGGHCNSLCLIRADVFEKKTQGIMSWFFKDVSEKRQKNNDTTN
jgi:AbrB family looped-hinge helix DNA binding protein